MNRKEFTISIVILAVVISVFGTFLLTLLKGENKTVIPIDSSKSDQSMTRVLLYFSNDRLNSEVECSNVYPVERFVPENSVLVRAALTELLKGPTEEEKEMGYMSNIPAGVEIQELYIKDKIIYADFNEMLEYQMGGSCRVIAIRAQITETLNQFPTIDEVVISINGRTKDILQP